MDDKQFINEQKLLTPKDVLGYAEEYVIDEDDKELKNYSLSNNLDDIQIAIYARTGLSITLDNAYWRLFPEVPINIKHLMNKHRVNYSMTTWYEEKKIYIVVYMRAGDKWFVTLQGEKNGKTSDVAEFSIMVNAMEFAMDHLRKRLLDAIGVDIRDYIKKE